MHPNESFAAPTHHQRSPALGRRVRALLRSLGVLAAALLITAGGAVAQAPEVVSDTDQAAKMIQEEQLAEAIELLDRVLQQEPEYWEAHYQRGRALALQGHMQEARDALVRAVELNPGFAHGHFLAWLAALQIEDYDTAWDQAIDAELGGIDMSEQFPKIIALSPTPEDILDRLGAPRLFVAPFGTDDIEGYAELPHNRNPLVEENRISERPDAIQGAFRLQEATPELLELHRQMRLAIQDAPYLGLTLEPRGATIFVKLTIDTLSERSPRQLEGTLEAVDIETGAARWTREILLRDISSVGAVVPQIRRYVTEMQGELRYRAEQ